MRHPGKILPVYQQMWNAEHKGRFFSAHTVLWCGLTKAVRYWERFELKVTRDCIRYSPQYDDRMYEQRAVYIADSYDCAL